MTSPAVKLLAGFGGGASDEPPTVSLQIACWWADDLVGTYADGDPVDSWTDRTGSYVVSATSGTRPTFRASGVAGKAAVDFDGTDDILRLAESGWNSSPDGVVVAVVEFDALTATNHTVWASADEATNVRYVQGAVRNVSGTRYIYIAHNNNGTTDARRGNTTVLTTSTPYALEWSSSGTGWTLYVDNGSESETGVSGTDSGDWFADTDFRDNFTMGELKVSAAGDRLNGKIAFLMVANDELSSGDRTALYGWISDYYGI